MDDPPIMPQATTAPARHAFVYGTLRRGDANDITRLVPPPRFVGMATIAGRLFDLGRYPGVLLGGSATVLGEVYEILPALESVLDEIEEVYPQQSGEYVKREVTVHVGAQALRCLVYEINPACVEGRPAIDSGDWVAHGRSSHREN